MVQEWEKGLAQHSMAFSATLAASKRNNSNNIQYYSQKEINMAGHIQGTELLHEEMLFLHIAFTFQNNYF